MDPYQVLGVSRNATDEEIKKAYRTLSKKYHPDANIGNPNQAAYTEKFKEVQNAYDQIMKERKNGGSYQQTHQQYSQGYGSYQGSASQAFNDVINAINRQDYQTAWQLLDRCPVKNDQWFYLSAIINSHLGNDIIALDHIRQAIRINPMNMQYQILYSQLQAGSRQYRQTSSQYGRSTFDPSTYCCSLIALNMACNLCCRGGILCC